jgi:hypothetical protein
MRSVAEGAARGQGKMWDVRGGVERVRGLVASGFVICRTYGSVVPRGAAQAAGRETDSREPP